MSGAKSAAATKETDEVAVAAEEVLDNLYQLSESLNTGLSKETLSNSLDLISDGLDPSTLASQRRRWGGSGEESSLKMFQFLYILLLNPLPSLPCTPNMAAAAIYHLYLLNDQDSPIFKDSYASARFNGVADAAAAPPHSQTASPTFNDMITALVGSTNKRTSLPPPNASDNTHMHQDVMDLVAHASLDVIEDVQTKSSSIFNGWSVSAFVTPTDTRFILLHQVRNDDNIRLFFQECWEAYLKTLLNPFYTPTDTIRTPAFSEKLQKSARKYL
ncbi:hypothetical protein E3P99_02104 [Wallemia hederae]|uniref:Uncharacterized protein n=1 Tax=Wallemia hederae TaxID=1540922 RepID=A0A4T0FME8_9BASI|nr:hypothetical protein E3P99_02104 [Wallemia hederae]